MNIWLTTYLSTDYINRNGAAQARMLKSFIDNGFAGTLLMANEINRPNYPLPKVMEYGFKAACINEAMDHGADIAIWSDSNMVLLKSFEELVQVILENPVFLMKNAWNVGQWSTPESLTLAGLTRQEAYSIPTVVSGFFAIDLRQERSFAEEFILHCQNPKILNGPRTIKSPDSRVNDYYGHRHDQIILSIMAHKRGIKLTEGYYSDPANAVGHHERPFITRTERSLIQWELS
jgi:hypothetical protein